MFKGTSLDEKGHNQKQENYEKKNPTGKGELYR